MHTFILSKTFFCSTSFFCFVTSKKCLETEMALELLVMWYGCCSDTNLCSWSTMLANHFSLTVWSFGFSDSCQAAQTKSIVLIVSPNSLTLQMAYTLISNSICFWKRYTFTFNTIHFICLFKGCLWSVSLLAGVSVWTVWIY